MNKKLLWLAIPIAIAAIVGIALSFGGKKVAEKTVENALERSTNGQADVDLDNGSVKVNVNGGTYEVGEEVDLPDDFPEDVHVIDGTIKSAVTLSASNGYNLIIETDESPSAVADEYDRELKSDGWNITATTAFSGSYSISGEKGNRTVAVSAGESEGQTSVTIMVFTQNASD